MSEHTHPARDSGAASTSSSGGAPRESLGLSFLAIVGLAALGLPRVVLHDLHVIDERSPLSWILSLGPVAIWVAVTVAKKLPRPFLTNFLIGVTFGVMLVVTHQLLWSAAFPDGYPSLGDGPLGSIVPRLAVVPGGLFAGALLGSVGGLMAWAILRATSRKGRDN